MKEFDNLKDIIDKLRSPDGCPWDKEQTHNSLLSFLLEETYEVSDSIIKKDKESLKEELGDLLLQIMLHSKIAEENNDFDIKEVIDILNSKLTRRHPHVFGNEKVSKSEEVIKLWESVKKTEKENKKSNSIFDNIPNTFPPLLKSYKIQKEAAKVGFDWPDYNGVIEKIKEEIDELHNAIKSNGNIEHELGDIFLALVNLGRFLHIRSDAALERANLRFIKRFQYIENIIKEEKKEITDYDLNSLEKLWQEAKKLENE